MPTKSGNNRNRRKLVAPKIERARVKMEQIKPGSTRPKGKKKAANL